MHIYELSPGAFWRITPLIQTVWRDRALIAGIIEGTSAGRIFVDDTAQPNAAFIAAHGGDYFLVGDPNARAMTQFLSDRPHEADVFNGVFAYFVDTAWCDTLFQTGIPHLQPARAFRHIDPDFPSLAHWQAHARPDAIVRPIDLTLIGQLDDGDVRPGEFKRDTLAQIVADGRFGLCVLVDDEIVSVAEAFSASSHYANIFIDTATAYRQQGLATLASAAFIHHCRANGITALWGCLSDNIASGKTAEKLGFTEEAPQLESYWRPYPDDHPPSRGRWQAYAPLDGTIIWKRSGADELVKKGAQHEPCG